MPKVIAEQSRELLRKYDVLRSAAHELQRQFRDRGDHYEFVGAMNDVEWVRTALKDVESYIIENDIDIPEDEQQQES